MLATIFVAAIAALPLVASQGIPANCDRNYTVVAGDTCDAISAAHNASTYQLAVVNSPTIDPSCSNLGIGQVICLGTTGEDCANTYVVVPNDTCDSIANAAGINATILYGNNPQINSDCTNVYIGEVLCTLPQIRVPPAPGNILAPVVPAALGTAPAGPAPSQAPAGDDLPWCSDPNDNGEW